MIAFALVTLFSVVALGTVLVLADGTIRGRNAFAQLRRELERADTVRAAHVVWIGDEAGALPTLRGRPVSRVQAAAPQRLRSMPVAAAA